MTVEPGVTHHNSKSTNDTKWCNGCKRDLPLSSFYKNRKAKRSVHQLQGRCKDCQKAAYKEWLARPESKEKMRTLTRNWRANNVEHVRLYKRAAALKQYGLTLEDYDDLLKAQEGLCAACGVKPKRKLHVDHDHTTGEVRGLLCTNCNTALGLLGDYSEGVLRLYGYIHKFEMKQQGGE